MVIANRNSDRVVLMKMTNEEAVEDRTTEEELKTLIMMTMKTITEAEEGLLEGDHPRREAETKTMKWSTRMALKI
jgi:hypothetical protein